MDTFPFSSYKEIKPEDVSLKPFSAFHETAVLTAGNETKCNSMLIGLGGFGTWLSIPMATVYVKQIRYTKQLMDSSEYFSICFFPREMRGKTNYFATHSGRDEDKYKGSGIKPFKIDDSIGLEGATEVYICKKIYSGDIDSKKVVDCQAKKNFFNLDDPMDYFTFYMGEVVRVLVKKD